MCARLHDAATAGDVHQIFLTVDEKWDHFAMIRASWICSSPYAVVARILVAARVTLVRQPTLQMIHQDVIGHSRPCNR